MIGRVGLAALWLTLAGLGFAACSDAPPTGELCDPGTNVYCRCPGGESGTRACNASGDGYEACVVGPSAACPDRSGMNQVCTAGVAYYCMCSDATDGTRECLPDGSGFSDCDCSATGGAGVGGAGGGSPGDAPLYSPCAEGADCASGLCPMGYCTKTCAAVPDCEIGVAECVPFGGQNHCRPLCSTQLDCAPFLQPSECGYGKAIDDWGVTVCADWLGALALPPAGTICSDDDDCHLGHTGKERVCHALQGVCEAGCHDSVDCASRLCDASFEPGACF